jgi:hypothetical protein
MILFYPEFPPPDELPAPESIVALFYDLSGEVAP